MPADPRYNTKLWIQTYWIAANVTKDDGTTPAITACIYSYPDYPLTLEFIGGSGVDGLILIGEPNSMPQRGHDQYIYGYEEYVPIILCTVNKTYITGIKLRWKMEAELRRIAETNPAGSQRNLEKRADRTERMGSTVIYMAEYILNYMRDTT